VGERWQREGRGEAEEQGMGVGTEKQRWTLSREPEKATAALPPVAIAKEAPGRRARSHTKESTEGGAMQQNRIERVKFAQTAPPSPPGHLAFTRQNDSKKGMVWVGKKRRKKACVAA
jgi:hypothetical protein